MTIRASAPGKIILFGEHAVVYGRPALAVPVTQVHADVEAAFLTDLETDSSTDFEADKRTQTDSSTDSQTDKRTQTDSSTDSQANKRTETDSSTDWQADKRTETDSSADSEADKRTETDSSTDFEADKRTQTDSSADSEADKRTETDAAADLEADKRTETDAAADLYENDWRQQVWIDAPDIGLSTSLGALHEKQTPHALAAVIEATVNALGLSALPPMRLRITSSIPVASGLGSGAAVSVALIRAVAEAVGKTLDNEQVNAIAYEVEKLHHGTPSGIDNTVITYARPVYFVRGQPIETFTVGAPFTIVIGDSGITAPTRESVGDVRKLWEADKPRWEAVFDQVGEIVWQARQAIERGDNAALGPLMDANHALLQAMTVSCPELDRLVLAARAAGALGAKLSGGGRGGNMIALAEDDKVEAICQALYQAGAKNVIVTGVC